LPDSNLASQDLSACSSWSWLNHSYVPAVILEGTSDSSWVSRKHLQYLLIDPTTVRLRGEDKFSESVGQLHLVSTGVVHLWVHPRGCQTSRFIKFKVTDDPNCCDILIGRHDALYVESARKSFALHHSTEPYNAPLLDALESGSKSELPDVSAGFIGDFIKQRGFFFQIVIILVIVVDLCLNIPRPWTEWTSGRLLTFLYSYFTESSSALFPIGQPGLFVEMLLLVSWCMSIFWQYPETWSWLKRKARLSFVLRFTANRR